MLSYSVVGSNAWSIVNVGWPIGDSPWKWEAWFEYGKLDSGLNGGLVGEVNRSLELLQARAPSRVLVFPRNSVTFFLSWEEDESTFLVEGAKRGLLDTSQAAWGPIQGSLCVDAHMSRMSHRGGASRRSACVSDDMSSLEVAPLICKENLSNIDQRVGGPESKVRGQRATCKTEFRIRRGSPRDLQRSEEKDLQPDFVRIGVTLMWEVWPAVLRGLRTTPAGPFGVDREVR